MLVAAKKPLFRRLRLLAILCLGALLLVLLEPHALHFAVRQALVRNAARHGVKLTVERIEGTLFEPLVFQNVALTSKRNGVATNTRMRSATVRLSWLALLRRGGAGFFDRLTLQDVRGDIQFSRSAEALLEPASPVATSTPLADASPSGGLPRRLWLPVPTVLEIREGSLTVAAGRARIIASGVECSISGVEQGTLEVDSMQISQGAFSRTFANLKGTTGRQQTRLLFADITCAPGVLINSLSTDATDPSGRVGFDATAFGGSIRGEWLHSSDAAQPVYEATGSFYGIGVTALAEFLGVEEKTGGVIKEGKFTFRGAPNALEQATLSTRLEAEDFLWGRRQWNTLVLGATVVNGRVQVPELRLQQVHNALHLKGEFLIPRKGVAWWASEFAFDLVAQIDNVTELSALFGARFADTAGKATINGSIQAKEQSFTGQLTLSGSGLRYREAPLETLHADIRLEGNEIRILNAELTNGADHLRGKGAVNILGEKRYAGEVTASINALETYRPLLVKPLTPVPLEGGLTLNWSGDGTRLAHSGAFTASFRKLRTPGNEELPATLPIDADLEGTYAPGSLSLTQCRLAHGETQLQTRLTAGEETLRFEDVRLTRKKAVWLEGHATLPVNLWRWWSAPGLTALAPDAPFNVELTAREVRLEEVATLTGRPLPVGGLLSGPLTIGGTLRAVEMNGTLQLTRGLIPASPLLPSLDEVEATLELAGKRLRIPAFKAKHEAGVFTGTVAADFADFEAPTFEATFRSERVRFDLGEASGWQGEATVEGTLSGTRQSALLSGTARPLALTRAVEPDFGTLIAPTGADALNMPPPAAPLPPSWSGWRFEVAIETAGRAVPLPGGGELEAALQLRRATPSPTPLVATGGLIWRGTPFKSRHAAGTVEEATFLWASPDTPPQLAARLVGKAGGTRFTGYFAGAPGEIAATFLTEPPLTEERLKETFATGFSPLPPEAGQLAPELGVPFQNPQPAPPSEAEGPPSTASP